MRKNFLKAPLKENEPLSLEVGKNSIGENGHWELDSGVRQTWVKIWPVPLKSYMTLGILPNSSQLLLLYL